ncbi:metallophosphoesterase [Planosporangium mesophilum]|uniref:Metallophosphatase n=1 Tax=Planosporangium mesophilum TaxID=689768 RepID=A0A8J3TAI7_9ACTN|nr:metallophosphoesterase [Planosporangium mesophilum]NJC82271.1 metallophosphoesterase [Planosporangium mesophilum]GII22322.1 metallophosphatase [Planosporangium mesophilum]
MISAFLLVVVLVVGLLHLYLWTRLVRDTTRPGRWRRIGTVLIIALAVLAPATVAATRALPLDSQRLLAWPGYLWLSVMFLAFTVLLVLEIPRLALRPWVRRRKAVVAAEPEPAVVDSPPGVADPSRRLLLARSAAIVAGLTAVGATAVGTRTAMGPPTVVRRQITLRKLPRRMDGFRIAVVSDIHLGPLLGRGHTQRIVDTINRLDADLVTVVGDLVDGSVAELGSAARPLSGLRSRRGSFFVTGNHEYFSGYQEWIPEIESYGLSVLRNERVEIDGLDLAGVNDVTGAQYGDGPDFGLALADRDPAKPVVLMAHQPIQVLDAQHHGVDLQLSGHTHGGQIFPFSYLVRLQQPVIAGYARFGDTQLYVTRGAGFWGPPVRVGAPPDITLIELRSA